MKQNHLLVLVLVLVLGSFGFCPLGCSGDRLHVGDDGFGGSHGGNGAGQAGQGGGQAGATAGGAGSASPSGGAGTTGSAGTTGTAGATGLAGAGGASAGGALTVNPSAATFAGTLVESVSAPQTFTVRNDGAATIALAALQGTNATDFVIESNQCGATLQPSASCTVTVAFAPKIRSGAKTASLALTISSNPAASVSLSGTAVPSLTLLAGAVGGLGYANGTGADSRFYYPVDVASDGAGNLYVADRYNYVIRKITLATGAVTTFAGNPHTQGSPDGTGTAAGFDDLRSITSDGTGALFVVDGTHIRKIDVATGAVTTLADGEGTPVYISGPSGIASDGAGALYVADTDTSTVRRIDVATGTITTVADRTGVSIHFDALADLVSDRAGNLYVADSCAIEKVVVATGALTTVAGALGEAGSSDGIGTAARFGVLSGIALDGAGNLFVAEGGQNTVRKVVLATGAVTTLAGASNEYGSLDGTGAAARFGNPQGLCTDGAGNLFVADEYNGTIRKVAVASGAVTTVAGLAHLPTNGVDGIGPAARFASPQGIATDGAGNLYVPEIDDNTIRKIVIATGAVTTFAGASAQTAGLVDGTGAAARFSTPSGIVADGAGNLFITDAENAAVRKIAIATRAVTTLAGGQYGTTDGTGTAARFNRMFGIALDGAGNLFIADSDNATIRKIVIATRVVTTLAGSADTPGSADGKGAAASFYFPCGIASDGAGNLYVSDTGNRTLRKVVVATGVVTTFAGKAGENTTVDGIGTAARFTAPASITSDGAGNLYVVDGSTIRKVVLATAAVSTVLGVPGRTGVSLGALPASLNGPFDVAILPTGELAIVDMLENAVLIAHL